MVHEAPRLGLAHSGSSAGLMIAQQQQQQHFPLVIFILKCHTCFMEDQLHLAQEMRLKLQPPCQHYSSFKTVT